nr:methyltransferase domain-containing protein [Brevibacillus borstelensis]
MKLAEPSSVIDIGCGVGAWLSAFRENGVKEILGVDGEYVNRDLLHIPPEFFLGADISQPLDLGGKRYDLAICMEVAEHIWHLSAGVLVDTLTKLSDMILFSAAIPWQGGTHHVNERWIHYWIELFEQRGYKAVDAIRRKVWNSPDVEPCYKQNSIIFCTQEKLDNIVNLQREYERTDLNMISIVHPDIYLTRLAQTGMITLNSYKKLDKKIIVFGTGGISEVICNNSNIQISYFIDNNKKKWGSNFLGKPVKSPEAILEESKDSFAVIILSSYYQQIAKQVKGFGLEENTDFWNGLLEYNE